MTQRDPREVLESPVIQGVREERAYTFPFANQGVTAIEDDATVLVLSRGEDVTDDVCPGAATTNGLNVTTPEVKDLTAGRTYIVYVGVPHDGGQYTELYCRIIAKE